jgi:hypothetical protein
MFMLVGTAVASSDDPQNWPRLNSSEFKRRFALEAASSNAYPWKPFPKWYVKKALQKVWIGQKIPEVLFVR